MTGPGADNFADATTFDYGSSSDPTPSGALTTEVGEPDPGAGLYDRTAWWTFTAPVTETVGIDTLLTDIPVGADPATYNTRVAIYTGSSLGTLTDVTVGFGHHRGLYAATPSPHGGLSEWNLNAVAGTTYYVQVASEPSSPDMDYVLRLGKRLVSYSDWLTMPDYDLSVSRNDSDTWSGASGVVMSNGKTVSKSASGISDANWNSTMRALFSTALTELAGFATWNHSYAAAVDTMVRLMEVTGASGVTNSRNLSLQVHAYADSHDPLIGGIEGFSIYDQLGTGISFPIEAQDMGTHPDEGQDASGSPGGDYGLVVGARFTKLQATMGGTHRSGSTPLFSINTMVEYSVLRGIPDKTDSNLWDFSDRVLVYDFSVSGSGNPYQAILTAPIDATHPVDVTDGVDQLGRFVLVMGLPTTLGSVTGGFGNSGFVFTTGYARTSGVAPDWTMTYTLRPPRYRFIYWDVDTGGGLGRLKVWSEADDEWLWQGEGSVSGETGMGRFKVWDGSDWRIAEPVPGEAGVGRMKIWDGTQWLVTLSSSVGAP